MRNFMKATRQCDIPCRHSLRTSFQVWLMMDCAIYPGGIIKKLKFIEFLEVFHRRMRHAMCDSEKILPNSSRTWPTFELHVWQSNVSSDSMPTLTKVNRLYMHWLKITKLHERNRRSFFMKGHHYFQETRNNDNRFQIY